MDDTLAVIVIVFTCALVLWATIRTKMRRVDGVKGELKTPLASVGFEATNSPQSTNSVDISNLEARNVTTGNIVAHGTHSTVNVRDLKAREDINLGDVISGDQQSPKGT